MQVATVIGIIWAGSLIASGMVANAGLAPVVALYAKDPAQAALTWQGIESVARRAGQRQWRNPGWPYDVAGQPGCAAGWWTSQGFEYPRFGGWRGGHHFPSPWADRTLARVFGLSQIVWFVWMGIVLLRSNPSKAA